MIYSKQSPALIVIRHVRDVQVGRSGNDERGVVGAESNDKTMSNREGSRTKEIAQL